MTVDEHLRHRTDDRSTAGTRALAVSATLHCLTGCAVGEIAGLLTGTALGLSTGATIALSVALAFVFGYALSTLPLLGSGLALGAALRVVLAADTVSILTMEVVDNLVMATVPGAMDAGLVNSVFWLAMAAALGAAFLAAYPVNAYLLQRGKGHALVHHLHGEAHHADHDSTATRARRVPVPSTATLATAVTTFLLGGLLVSLAAEADVDKASDTHAVTTDGWPGARG